LGEEVLEEEEQAAAASSWPQHPRPRQPQPPQRLRRRHLSAAWAPQMMGRGGRGAQQVTYGGPGAALVACPYAAGPAGAAAGGGAFGGEAGGVPGLGAAGAAFGGVPGSGFLPPGPGVPLEQQLPNLPLIDRGPVASLLPAFSPAPDAPWVQGIIQPAPIGGGALIPNTPRPFPQTGRR
jgi:hypothetical protein